MMHDVRQPAAAHSADEAVHAACSIRRVGGEDVRDIAAYLHRNRAHLAPFTPRRAPDFDSHEAIAQRVAEDSSSDGEQRRVWWTIREHDELVGSIAVSNISRGAFQSANVGYDIDHARQGRGLATAALALVVREAFGALGLHRLEAGTLLDNEASRRVLERNGFMRIGVSRAYLRIAGAWRDHVLYALTVEDLDP